MMTQLQPPDPQELTTIVQVQDILWADYHPFAFFHPNGTLASVFGYQTFRPLDQERIEQIKTRQLALLGEGATTIDGICAAVLHAAVKGYHRDMSPWHATATCARKSRQLLLAAANHPTPHRDAARASCTALHYLGDWYWPFKGAGITNLETHFLYFQHPFYDALIPLTIEEAPLLALWKEHRDDLETIAHALEDLGIKWAASGRWR